MSERILDFAEQPARLHVEIENLVIEPEGREVSRIPLAEIAAVVVSHPRVQFTLSVLSGLARARAMVVVCDERRMPAAMLLPLDAHFLQVERFRQQADASEPTRKRLWQQIVRAKVLAQARALVDVCGDDGGLAVLAREVRTGDDTNVESQAARLYWPRLFGDRDFRRDREREDQNRHLNYGYAVLRALVARGIVAAGLHPSLGLHHHNRYNSYCLADDLMEPYRPLVDIAVVDWLEDHEAGQPLDRSSKAFLIGRLLERFEAAGESRTLFDHINRLSSSLVRALLGESRDLELAELRRVGA